MIKIFIDEIDENECEENTELIAEYNVCEDKRFIAKYDTTYEEAELYKAVKGKKVYVCGRITGTEDYKERFANMEKKLKKLGAVVINPIKSEGFSYKDYIDMGLAELSKCDILYGENTDEIYESIGAMLEIAYATAVGIKVIIK